VQDKFDELIKKLEDAAIILQEILGNDKKDLYATNMIVSKYRLSDLIARMKYEKEENNGS